MCVCVCLWMVVGSETRADKTPHHWRTCHPLECWGFVCEIDVVACLKGCGRSRRTSSTSSESRAVLQFTFRVRSLHKRVSDGRIPVVLMPTVKLALVLSEGTCCVPFPCYF